MYKVVYYPAKIKLTDMPFGVLNILLHKINARSLLKLINGVFAEDVTRKELSLLKFHFETSLRMLASTS